MRRAVPLGLVALALALTGPTATAGPAFAAEPLAFPICLDPDEQEGADISGDKIVWEYYESTGIYLFGDIYLCDLSTGRTRPVCRRPLENQMAPAISGDVVVWEDYRNRSQTGADIYAFNLATGKETAICTDPGHQGEPDISGKYGRLARGIRERRRLLPGHLRPRLDLWRDSKAAAHSESEDRAWRCRVTPSRGSTGAARRLAPMTCTTSM